MRDLLEMVCAVAAGMCIVNAATATIDKLSTSNSLIIPLAQDGKFYVDGKINGSHVRFAVDTGAPDILLSGQIAKSIGIDLSSLKYDHRIRTPAGETSAAVVQLGDVAI